MSEKERFYAELVQVINRTLGRRAVTVERVRRTVNEAKRVKKMEGVPGLLAYATNLADRLFTPREAEMLKESPYRKVYSDRMIDLLVREKILTPLQGRMLKRTVR